MNGLWALLAVIGGFLSIDCIIFLALMRCETSQPVESPRELKVVLLFSLLVFLFGVWQLKNGFFYLR